MEQIEEIFSGKEACGVYVPSEEHLLATADLSLGTMTDWYTWPLAGSALASLSIPTTYSDNGVCMALFGENARSSHSAELLKQYGGAVLDGVAASILQEQGVDVGLVGERRIINGRVGFAVSPDLVEQTSLCYQSGRFFTTELSENAEVALFVTVDGNRIPLLYKYENALGQKFAVVMTDTLAKRYNSNIFRGFQMQHAMTEAVHWIADKTLPAVCSGNPDLYLLCKKNHTALSVGLFNCFADSILEPIIMLDKPYSNIRFVNCDGYLDGSFVHLNSPVPAYGFAAFEVF